MGSVLQRCAYVLCMAVLTCAVVLVCSPVVRADITTQLVNVTNGALSIMGSGSAGTPASGVDTVQGISGMFPLTDHQNVISAVETTAQLSANATYTGPWYDSTAEGTNFVIGEAYSDQAGASNAFKIQGTDDTTNANFTRTLSNTTTVGAGSLAVVSANVNTHYYRIVYTNGSGGATTALEITRTASNIPNLTMLMDRDNPGVAAKITTFGFSDSNSTLNNVLGVASEELGYTGSVWERERSINGERKVTTGGATLTKVSSTSCTSVVSSATTVHRVWSAAASETATVSIYNEGASPTCAAADLIWSGVPSNTSPVTLDAALSAGFAYKLSAAAVNNDYVTSN